MISLKTIGRRSNALLAVPGVCVCNSCKPAVPSGYRPLETPLAWASKASALPIWATLRAYGRAGHREMVERHLDVTAHLGRLVNDSPDLELLAPVQLCIACFRYRPPGVPEERLDELNSRLGRELLADGRVYAGTTVYRNHVALRPAIVNWRTTQRDIDLLVDVVRELGARISSSG